MPLAPPEKSACRQCKSIICFPARRWDVYIHTPHTHKYTHSYLCMQIYTPTCIHIRHTYMCAKIHTCVIVTPS